MLRHRCAIAPILLLVGCGLAPPSADVAFGGASTPSTSGSNSGRDGTYAGTADVLVNGGTGCPRSMAIANFQVIGNQVRFGGFRATIAPDGSVPQTVAMGMYLTGRFDGTRFVGAVQTTDAGILTFEDCIYAINVTRQPA